MLTDRIKSVLEEVKKGNNLGEEILVVGATKTMSVEIINQAIDSGLQIVAENKVQEFNAKHDFISPIAKQHFIGHLQTNKVKYLVGKVDLIHSVDSVNLAKEIDKQAQKKNIKQNILIEINIGGELSKSGFSYEDAFTNIENIASEYKNLNLLGLMAMLPHTDDEQALEELCKKMRRLFDELKVKGFQFKYLSMGMSNDYKIAIKNGSNMIRLGTTIFGKRNYGDI